MLTAKKPNFIVYSILRILLAAVLLTTTCPITAYAADDNPTFGVLDIFPAKDVSLDTMNENQGTIATLGYGGTVKDNKGKISVSLGSVYENHGTIESLSSGHVGTNYGVINLIENTGSLGVNDTKGTVFFVRMGNRITRNDGTVQTNVGSITDNYGTVGENYGTVLMHDGQIVNNHQNVTFEAKIVDGETVPAKGTIDHNEGRVKIHSGTVTIKENTGTIEIENATVTVRSNSGNITVGDNAALICSENMSSGLITKSSENADIDCDHNYGYIYDETAVWYKIVFAGDDGKAEIVVCDFEKDGVSYTQSGGGVIFTLPPEYECASAMKVESGDVNTWIVFAAPAEGSTEFTILCHRCSPGDYRMTEDRHWQECDGCGKLWNEGAHTAGGYLSDDNSTCIKDGTETYRCTECGYFHTRIAVDSHLTSDHHEHIVIDPGVDPTETSTGLTQGSHCEDCRKILTAQEILPVLGHNWQDATCTAPKTCLNCGASEGKALGHIWGSWTVSQEPACTDAGIRVRICERCHAEDTEELLALGHEWQNGFCRRCGEEEPFRFDCKDVALDSTLAFRFKGYLNDPDPAEDAYMEFRIGTVRTVNVPLSDAVRDEKGRYVFTCCLNVLEMDEKIEVRFRDGNVTVERRNPLSVTDYLNCVLERHQGGTDEYMKTVSLINAISNYAHYAQLALAETHTEYTVGEGGTYHGTAARSGFSVRAAEELAPFAAVRNVSDRFADVIGTSRSLVLDDETAIVLYITPGNTDYVPSVKVTDKNGNAAAFTCGRQENGRYKIVIRGIAAHMLGDNYTVDIDDGSLTYTHLSALSYAYSILSGSKSDACKNAVSALYDYCIAANAYRSLGEER